MSTHEKQSFSKYGKGFQESLAHLILEDRAFSEQMEEVLSVEFFELKYLRVFVQLVFSYKKKYEVHPTYDILSSIIRSELDHENEVVKKQLKDFFIRIGCEEAKDKKYIKETSLNFCKKQKLKEAILKSVDLIESSSFEEVKTVIDNAIKLGVDNNHGHDYKKDFEFRYQLKARAPVSTGWEKVDTICKNGLGKGELGVVIAPTGAGKSMALAHLGAAALKEGKNVVHYTLELSESVIGLRYDSCLSGVGLKDLFSLKEQVYEKCVDIEGELIIKEYPTKSASPRTLCNHLEKLKNRGFSPDLIIVDYGDILRPSSNFKEKRNELETIYEELRAMAQQYECPVWTASQTNRSGLNAEVITMESISEAFNKCFVADFICSISRTVEDKNANTGRMFVAKNRNGPDGLIFNLNMDTSCVKIEVVEQSSATIEQTRNISLKNQADALKEKYKKFKQSENGVN